ncbi:MAG: hypothetical protein PHT69_03795 [Bacteroidales bacterium]|nr:hypothetical protein [Bacteroidales bacterium]
MKKTNKETIITDICQKIITENPNILPPDKAGISLDFNLLAESVKNFHPEIEPTQDLLQEVELCLCKMLKLNLNNYAAIALCLNDAYPNADLVNITDKEVIELIKKMPNIEKSNLNLFDKDTIDAIIYVWIELSNENTYNDSKWDAYI